MFLETMQLDKEVIDRLLPPIDPNAPPPPEAQKLMAEVARLQAEVANISAQATLAAEKNALEKDKLMQDMKESESRINESVARAWKMQGDHAVNMVKMKTTHDKMLAEEQFKAYQLAHQIDNDQAQTLTAAHQVKQDGELKKEEIQAKKSEEGKTSKKAPEYSDEDIKHTARLKNMSVKNVKKSLGIL